MAGDILMTDAPPFSFHQPSMQINVKPQVLTTVNAHTKEVKAAHYDSDGSDAEIQSDSEHEEEPLEMISTVRRVGKKQQKDTFEKWFAEKALSIQTNPVKLAEGAKDEELTSVKSLLSMTTKSIISDPREYQLELFEKAKQQNTLAVLDTGSGKTLIATLLIRWVIDQELEERRKGAKPKICLFLVNSVTLVFQQAAVLECNLDASVGKFCGEMGTDLWTRDQWQQKVKEHKIFVATADTIFNCLTHSFLGISDFNLLIFDECHHAKKSHAYARIMKEFYEYEPFQSRPRIFGMTASPVDARVDVVKAAQRLEALLHSRICTTSDLSLLQKFFKKPIEHTLDFPSLPYPPLTTLNMKLHPFRKTKCFSPIFRFVDSAIKDLGPWCVDEVWKFGLTELEAARQERRAGSTRNMNGVPDDPKEVEAEIQLIREARKIVEAHSFESPKADLTFVSPKLLMLYQYLQHTYWRTSDQKCIVFVTRRYTAKCIELLFRELGVKNLRMGTLFGTSGFSLGNDSMTFRAQTVTLHRFRKGNLNCLIATSVAEEGLDIPDCNLVIRFDLYTTMIQYIQSRGRARHTASQYIHMVEKDNEQHKQIVQDGRDSERLMKQFCEKLPEDRLLDRSIAPNDLSGFDLLQDPVYFVASTGAKLTLNSSMQVLARFVDRLGNEEGMAAERAIYLVEPIQDRGFRCEIKFPTISPITSVEGTSCRSKAQCKQLAAFAACKLLHEKKYLDDYLMPIFTEKIRPLMANAHLAVDLYKTNTYPSRLKPSFWDIPSPEPPKQLYATVFTLRDPDQTERNTQGICMLTRDRPPHFPPFPLYFDRGGTSLVDCTTLTEVLPITPSLLKKLNKFTFRFFVDIFNKEFEITEYQPYWILPLKFRKTVFPHSSLSDMIDWELMELCQTIDEQSYNAETTHPDFYVGKFMLDRRQGARRFYVHSHEPKYNQYDPIPAGASNAPHTTTIIDYSYSAGKKGWQKYAGEVPSSQPVMLADRVLHRLNCLDPPTEREKTQNTSAYICPSPFRVSPLPAKFCTMGLLFPAIITRVDSYLHAFDVCNLLNVEMSLSVALEALTKDSDNTSNEEGEAPVNKRRGMGNNYERLEFLGDCFLKLATTIALFAQNPDNDEFEYHVKRMILVCNQNLFNHAREKELYKYIQTEGFSRRLWYPEIKLLRGKGVGKTLTERTHRLSDKSVADVCEALIGAALSDRGHDMAARVVTALLNTDQHQIKSFKDYYPLYNIPEYQSAAVTASQMELANQIEKEMGYRFKYPRLLRSAFTHPSFPAAWERIPSYERLEFLGDALIDQACVEDLWVRCPGKDPQWLTEHKMSMINNRFQGALCVKLGFHRHIRTMGAHINAAIQEYVTLVEEARTVSNNSVDYWVDVTAPPKALPDILEAFVGAIFVDSEFNYNVVKDFYQKHWGPFFKDMSIFDSFAGNHPVTHLASKMAELGCTDWRIFSKEFKDRDSSYVLSGVMFHTTVLAEGKASSAKNSRTNAARQALEKLDKINMKEFGKSCTCAQVRSLEEQEREVEKVRKQLAKQELLKEQAVASAA